MKEPAHKELIEGLKDLFQDYQEEYVAGEWEAFSKSATKKTVTRLLPIYIKIAAAILLMLSVLPFSLTQNPDGILTGMKDTVRVPVVPENQLLEKNTEEPYLAQTEKNTVKSGTEKQFSVPQSAGSLMNNSVHQLSIRNKTSGNQGLKVAVSPEKAPILSNSSTAVTAEEKPQYVALEDKMISTETPATGTSSTLMNQRTADFLRSESALAQTTAVTKKKEKTGKWDFGIEISPTVIQSNLNLGAGITTAYQVSKKIAVSSGISMTRLNVANGIPASSASSAVASSLNTKQLMEIDANISAIDIPIGLIYKVTGNLYASAGVSYFNVLHDERSHTYLQTAEVSRTVSDPQTGLSHFSQEVKSEAVAEPSAESPLKGNGYLGFFNFSIGRQQQIFNQYHIVIEPFVKIPMGRLSEQELKLGNSGIKVKFSF